MESTIQKQTNNIPSNPKEETREFERFLTPPVDIFEKDDSLIVIADIPGVEKDKLDLNVDNNILTIKAQNSYRLPENVIQKEYQLLNFFRQFHLSEEIDQEKISAEIKNGVIRIILPKVKKPEPKKIEIKIS